MWHHVVSIPYASSRRLTTDYYTDTNHIYEYLLQFHLLLKYTRKKQHDIEYVKVEKRENRCGTKNLPSICSMYLLVG